MFLANVNFQPSIQTWTLREACRLSSGQVSHYRQYPKGTQYAWDLGYSLVREIRCHLYVLTWLRCTVTSRVVDVTERVGMKFASSVMSQAAIHLCHFGWKEECIHVSGRGKQCLRWNQRGLQYFLKRYLTGQVVLLLVPLQLPPTRQVWQLVERC